jgi:hypothetical protein
VGELLVRRIQKHYSVEKMDRIVGQADRMAKTSGLFKITTLLPDHVVLEKFKALKTVDVDVKVGFQEASPTARASVMNLMMQLKAAGAPIPLDLIIEASDVPYKEEILAALKKQGEQPVNPDLAKIMGASQGAQPNGVNES